MLGKDFKGVLGCDGWSTYFVYAKDTGILLQRCWAHALRELKEICYNKKRQDKSLVKALHDIFEKVKEARTSREIREQFYMELVGVLMMELPPTSL